MLHARIKIKNVLLVQVFLALAMSTQGKGSNRCRFKLRGNGIINYHSDETGVNSTAFSKKEITGAKECIISGKVTWTRDIVLVLPNNTRKDLLRFYEYERQTSPYERTQNSAYLSEMKKFSGNVSQYFIIAFAGRKSNFTLRYTTVKARKFRCSKTWQGVARFEKINCKNGRKFGSRCTFLSQIFAWSRPTEIYARCGKNRFGAPSWIIEDERERLEEDKDFALTAEAPNYGIAHEDNSGNEIDTVCDLSHCHTFPESIQVVSCTNGTKLGSNCTLQCKKGYVPPPHLYKEEKNIFPRLREEVPLFWTECGYNPRLDTLATWRPQVSTNGWKNFRNPAESYLDCIELQAVIDIFLDPRKYYLDFLTARDFRKCPYEDEEIFRFLGEKDDGGMPPSEKEEELLQEMALQPRDSMYARLPTMMIVPEELFTLNDEEWRLAIQSLQDIWCKSDVESLKMALFQRPPVTEPNVVNVEKVQSVVAELSELVSSRCNDGGVTSHSEEERREGECDQYCVWDSNRGGYIPCGSFSGAKNKMNCIRCKLRVGCSKSNFLG